MNNTSKNIIFILVALAFSYYSASYFGQAYEYLFGGESVWIGSAESWHFIIGIIFSYTFFITLVMEAFAFGSRHKWTLWLLLPSFFITGSGDIKHIYFPILIGLVAWGLASAIRKIFKIGTKTNQLS